MVRKDEEHSLELSAVERHSLQENIEDVSLHTNAGVIHGILHTAQAPGSGGVVWVGGADGGLDGPAGGLYPRMSQQLAGQGVASLRLDYRFPNDFVPCVLDTLLGVAFLESLERDRIALVGHSFGGAVVITAGALSEAVTGVAALASQTAGTELATRLGRRRLFLAHGSADRVLPDYCSRDIYKRAGGRRDLQLYPNCGHNFDECRQNLEADLLAWMRKLFQM